MPLQASVFMLLEQVAALDFPKCHFDRHKVALRHPRSGTSKNQNYRHYSIVFMSIT